MPWLRRGATGRDAAASAELASPGVEPPRLQPINEAERQWISDNLAQLRSHGVDVADGGQLSACFDTMLNSWECRSETERADPNELINVIGIGLGEHLVCRAGLQWVVATDEAGTELAVRGQSGSVIIYPTNVVAKRWVAGERAFLGRFADDVVQRIAEIRATADS